MEQGLGVKQRAAEVELQNLDRSYVPARLV